MRPDPIVKHGWHWSFGWLRRPEHDQDEMFCYEQPDGDLILTPYPAHKIAIYLDCRIDVKTGDYYTCFSKVPKRPMTYDPSAKSSVARRNAKG
jgi:hypothetical protein